LLNKFGRPHLQEHQRNRHKFSTQLKSLNQTPQNPPNHLVFNKLDNPNMPYKATTITRKWTWLWSWSWWSSFNKNWDMFGLLPVDPWGSEAMMQFQWKGVASFSLVVFQGRVYVESYHESFQTRDVFTVSGIVKLIRVYPGRLNQIIYLWHLISIKNIFGLASVIFSPLWAYHEYNIAHRWQDSLCWILSLWV